MKTLGAKYILISSDSKKEVFLQWKKNNMYKTMSNTPMAAENMRYMERKNLISQLRPQNIIQNAPNNNRQETIKHIQTSASTNKITPYVYANPERQNITVSNFHSHRQSHKTLYRSRSLSKGLHRFKEPGLPKRQLNTQEVKEKVMQSLRMKDGRIVCIMTMRRSGLRFKLSHKFFVCSKSTLHKQFTSSAKSQLFPEIPSKALYLFHLSKQPINNIPKDLDTKQYIIFGDITPKFNLSFEIQMKLFEQASAIEDIIKKAMSECQKQLEEKQFMESQGEKVVYYGSELRRIKYEQDLRDNERRKEKYQWEKIGNVKDYVQRLINNPQMIAESNHNPVSKDQVQEWCDQNYIQTEKDNLAIDEPQTQEQKKQEKNPFFDIHTHYPKETSNKVGLEATLERMQEREFTKNTHEVKHTSLENMMEKIKREKEKFVRLKAQEIERIKTLGYKSGKQFLRVMDEKNSLLVKQNIPYIMEKYGITRAEAYNLYNLYKSLEKISAMRTFDKNEHVIVKEKGIDRDTFDEGLKALEINPGEEVIRNICYFPEYITWEEFIKIISISLRKTTESKLEAILQGIGSSSVGELSQHQISIMINSSLHKIFGKEQPELRQHFVHVVMKNLDKNQSNTIDCGQLKAHVLQSSPQNMDLISYLILNS